MVLALEIITGEEVFEGNGVFDFKRVQVVNGVDEIVEVGVVAPDSWGLGD
jgi:hypothetical protein